jgi:hypothetical protein
MKYTPLTISNIHFSGFKTKIWWKLAVERLGRAEYKLAAWEPCQESHTIFIGELQEEQKQRKTIILWHICSAYYSACDGDNDDDYDNVQVQL